MTDTGGYRWISLTTDYGTVDGFVAACKGVVATIAPDVSILDVTHHVPPGDVRRGALVLAQTLPFLPPAVHVGVVDPGVGTARRAVAIRAGGSVLVGPDNGLLPWAATELGGADRVVVLDRPDWHLTAVRATFHGRDIFAPVAAHLATGRPFEQAGTPIDPAELVTLTDPVVRAGHGYVEVEVLTVDRFGNVQLAAGPEVLAELGPKVAVAVAAGAAAFQVRTGDTFGSVPPGVLLLYLDSADHVTLAVNGGSAVERLALAPGDVIRLSPA
ncbi:SAM-dependent chlorinase/fluorinase [Actinocatenispora sera]|uniref:SAM hydrolase/SAM-dependent halogenase family protein n=1 Tax=Actinocatenispora sera TaxID=390989 RepID=UPI003408F83E